MRSEGITSRGGGWGGDVSHVLPTKPRRIPQRKPDPPSPIQLEPLPEGMVYVEKKKKPRRGGRPGPKVGTPSPLALEQHKVAKIIELYESGMSAKAAGEAVGCARPTALKYLREAGVEIRQQTFEIDIEEMKRLYVEERLSTRKVAELMGVSNTTVMKHLKAAGVQLRSRWAKAVGAEGEDG